MTASFALGESPDASSLEQRLLRLEAQVKELREENQALRQQLGEPARAGAGVPAPVSVVPMGKETRLAIGGFLHLNGEWGGAPDQRFPENDRIFLRKVRLGVKGSFAEQLDFVLQAEFGSNSLQALSSYRVQATDVFVVWRPDPGAMLTLGQFKTPFGYEQLLPEVKTIAIERTLASDVLTPGRQAGAMVSGELLDKRVVYAAAATNGLSANNSYNDNDQFLYSGRLAGTAFDFDGAKLTLGASYFTSRDSGAASQFAGRRVGEAVDAELSYAGAELSGELLRTHFLRNTGPDYVARGWSVIGSYFFVPSKWQAFARYETYDPNDTLRQDRSTVRTVGVNYYLRGDDLKLSVNYLMGKPPGSASDENRLIARVQVLY